MDNLITVYADQFERLRFIVNGVSRLDEAFHFQSDSRVFWQKNHFFEDEKEVSFYVFDKGFDDLMKAFEYCGFRSVSTKLQTGKIVTPRNDETNFSEGWLITPSVVKSVTKSLQKCSLDVLMSKWETARIKELENSGLDIGNFDDLMLPNIENLKDFFNQSATKNDYLLFLK